jgi:hypothetical protein
LSFSLKVKVEGFWAEADPKNYSIMDDFFLRFLEFSMSEIEN